MGQFFFFLFFSTDHHLSSTFTETDQNRPNHQIGPDWQPCIAVIADFPQLKESVSHVMA